MLELNINGGAWVAPSVKCLALDFGLGHDLTVVSHDLRVVRSNPALGSALGSVEPA